MDPDSYRRPVTLAASQQISWGLDYIRAAYGRPPWRARLRARLAAALLAAAIRAALRLGQPGPVITARVRRQLGDH